MRAKTLAGVVVKTIVIGAGAALLFWMWKAGQHHEAEAPEEPVATDVAVDTGKVARATLRQSIAAYAW